MRESVVVDAGVLSLHFVEDSRVRKYFNRIDEGKVRGLVSEINLSECYYKTCRKLGRQAADTSYFLLRSSRLRPVQDEELTRLAGLEKCRQRLDVSLADCFALALAKREKALLLTTDSELKKTKDIHVRFFAA